MLPEKNSEKIVSHQTMKLTQILKGITSLNPLTTSVPHSIETSQLIYNANQLTGFYKMGNIGRMD